MYDPFFGLFLARHGQHRPAHDARLHHARLAMARGQGRRALLTSLARASGWRRLAGLRLRRG